MELDYIDRPGSCRILRVENTTAGQVPHIIFPFQKIIKSFELIIEIGYYWGGFTLWLKRNSGENTKVIGYDISDAQREVFDPSVEYRIGDCFDTKVIEEIKNLISSSGKTLIFCDGGQKENEFNLYADFLKSGDVIMLHDYYDDEKIEPYNSFPESEGWIYSYESRFSNIKECIERNTLVPFFYEDFRRCLVGSFIKF